MQPSVGVAVFMFILSMSGPLVTFYSLPLIWKAAEIGFLALSLFFLGLACMTDPGVIPKSPSRDPILDILQAKAAANIANTRSIHIVVEHEGFRYKRILNSEVWTRLEPGKRRGQRYCTACNIWRPSHAHHCRTCNHCIAHFDHHCDTLGVCIGGLNHRWFTLFLLLALCGAVLLAGGAGMLVCKVLQGVKKVPWQFWVACFLEPFYLYAVLVTTFGCVHCVLMCADVSTKDCIQDGCCACNESVCAPGGFQYLVNSWRRQWCGRIHYTGCNAEADFEDEETLSPGIQSTQVTVHAGAITEDSVCDDVAEPLLSIQDMNNNSSRQHENHCVSPQLGFASGPYAGVLSEQWQPAAEPHLSDVRVAVEIQDGGLPSTQ